MSAKTIILFIVILAAASGGVYLYSYDMGLTEGYESGYTVGSTDGYDTGHEEGLASGYETGFDEGNSSGYEAGFSQGNDEGYDTGYSEGTVDGIQTGFTDGHSQGYTLGYSEGNITGYTLGYVDGNITGHLEGILLGNETGYDLGYLSGVIDGADSGYDARNPTYSEVLKFIWNDKTDKNDYVENVYVCRHFSRDVVSNAYDAGYRCFYVYLGFGDGAHAIVGFDTTDRGMVYYEPQTDDRVYPEVGKVYWDRTKYLPPAYDDTVVEILVIG